MATIAQILGEDRARQSWNAAWTRAKGMVSADSTNIVLRRIIAEQAVMEQALLKLIADLEARIQKLEERPIKYLGAWEQGAAYSANSIVTDRGSMWIAREDTIQRPGCEAWTLCVKKGRDGKDVR